MFILKFSIISLKTILLKAVFSTSLWKEKKKQSKLRKAKRKAMSKGNYGRRKKSGIATETRTIIPIPTST